MALRVLHQFPISHYCEKVRWVLDHKRIAYRIHNQLPGPHAFINRRLTGRSTVPVLVEEGRGISGSHAIALHLESCSPERPLLPRSSAARVVLDEVVRQFDEVVGPAVRRYAYSLIIPDAWLFRELFFGQYSAARRAVGSFLAWPVRRAITHMYRLNEPDVRASVRSILLGVDRVEALLEPGSEFLFEGRLSLADVTVASLLGPLVGPPGSPWSVELNVPELNALRVELRERAIGRYVTNVYKYRAAPAAA